MGEKGYSRRSVLKGLGAALGSKAGLDLISDTAAAPDKERVADGDDDLLTFILRTDPQVWQMFDNLEHRMLEEPSVQDWVYHWDHIYSGITTVADAFFLDNGHMNDVQANCPDDAITSTAIDGAAAGVALNGRMTNLQGPRTGEHQLPFYNQTGEGAVAGIEQEGEVDWIHEALSHSEEEFGHLGNTSVVQQIHRNNDWEIQEENYVLPGTNTVIRDYTLKNVSGEHKNGSFIYRMQANVNDEQQEFAVWKSHWNRLTAENGEILWDDDEGPYEIRMYSDTEPDDMDVMDTGPTEDIEETTESFGKKALGYFLDQYMYEEQLMGEAVQEAVEQISGQDDDLDLEDIADILDPDILEEIAEIQDLDYDPVQQWALHMVENMVYKPGDDFGDYVEELAEAPGELTEILENGSKTVFARYGAGQLSFNFDLKPGEVKTLSIFKQTGEETGRIEEAELPKNKRQEIVKRYWADEFSDLKYEKVRDSYKNWIEFDAMSIMMLREPSSGKIGAAGNLIPTYTRGWPRDMAFAAKALAKIGKEEYAKDAFRFLKGAVEESGSFAQCYDNDGELGALLPVEYDQSGQVLNGIVETYEVTGDEEFASEMYPLVRRIGENLWDARADNELALGAQDFREMLADIYLSIWTNTHIYNGAKKAARFEDEISDILGHGHDTKFNDLAESYGDATVEEFISRSGSEYITEYAYDGARKTPTSHVSHVFLTDFAQDYGVEDTFTQDWSFMTDHEVWKPVNYDLARAMMDQEGFFEAGVEFLENLREDRTVAGYIPEMEREAGEYQFSLPFAWSHASDIEAEILYNQKLSDGHTAV